MPNVDAIVNNSLEKKALGLLQRIQEKKDSVFGMERADYSNRSAAAYLKISRRVFDRLVNNFKIQPDVDPCERQDDEERKGYPAGRYSHALITELKELIEGSRDYSSIAVPFTPGSLISKV